MLGLKVGKATGSDAIPALFLKNTANSLSVPLTHIFHLSLKLGIFPEKWKWETTQHLCPILGRLFERTHNTIQMIWTKTLAIPSWTALTSTSLPTFVQTLTGLGIIQNPVNTSAEQASMFTAQTFSMSWYQPKFLYQESGYILMRRFSALDRIQTYVLSETSASSLNGATLCTAEQVTLAGAAALTAITAGLNFLLFAM